MKTVLGWLESAAHTWAHLPLAGQLMPAAVRDRLCGRYDVLHGGTA